MERRAQGAKRPQVSIEAVEVGAYRIPTDQPEEDGTLEWDATTMVVVEVAAGGVTGTGYTYGESAIADIVRDKLAPTVEGLDALATGRAWDKMGGVIRNAGRPGVGMMAVAAVDTALWDLKGRLLGLPVVDLVGAAHDRVPVYGSGGFTNYSLERLGRQVEEWVGQGIPRVKIKTSRRPAEDPRRLDCVRRVAGDQTEVLVDANGALSRKEALYWADRFHGEWGVSWFEEPVTSDDFEGLRLLRDRAPGGMDIAAGEYGFVLADFRKLLEGGCVDCLQADVTRCGGITGVLLVSALCDAHTLDISGHCAPSASAHALSGAHHLRHLEFFHDHVRIEAMAFEGTLQPRGGCLEPDRSRPGLGLELKSADLARYRIL